MSEFAQKDIHSTSIAPEDRIISDIAEMSFSSKEDKEILRENFLTSYHSIGAFLRDSRYLAAIEQYRQLMKIFDYPPNDNVSVVEHEMSFLQLPEIQLLLESHNLKDEPLRQTITRAKAVHDAINYQDDESMWILGAHMFGMKTWYRLDSDNSIILKLEGEFDDLPIFELCSVIKEVDLFNEWVPFCKESSMVDRISHHELIP
jgi:hypothetical protein